MSEHEQISGPHFRSGVFENFTEEEKVFLQTEKSKSLKFLFLKFKCIIVLAVTIIAVLEFIFILIREIHASISSASQLTTVLNTLFNQTFFYKNNTVDALNKR